MHQADIQLSGESILSAGGSSLQPGGSPFQLTLFDMPPAVTWRLPEARRDRDSRLAVLLRNILWQHEKGGCRASNEFFASDPTMGLGRDVATVRRALADLEICGLIRREFDDWGQRTIVPLVTAPELLKAGWEALARAIVGMKQWADDVRKAARELLRGLGKWRPAASSSGRNCAAIARTIARPFPYKERKAQKTTTAQSKKTEAPSEAQKASVAVSASHEPKRVTTALPESVQLAVEAGLSASSARTVTADKPVGAIRSAIQAAKAYAATHQVTNLPGLLSKAIREGWLPPAPPSNHASDRGERTYRVVAAPAGFALETPENVKPSKPITEAFVIGAGYEAAKAALPWARKHSAPNNQAEGSILQGVI